MSFSPQTRPAPGGRLGRLGRYQKGVLLLLGAMTHKGVWPLWACGVLLCALTAVSILFADELFRLGLALRIRDADCAQPSGLEIAGRYLSWTVLPAVALAVFVAGLK